MVNKRSCAFFLLCSTIFFYSFAYADDASIGREADAAFKAKDYTSALSKYTALAENGNAGAQYNVGVFYLNGMGVQKDEKQAYAWLKKSATKGNSRAKQVIENAAAKGNLYASEALKELQQPSPTPAPPAVTLKPNADANKKPAVSEQTSRWFAAIAINTEEIYAAFVAHYPDGEYTTAAGDKIWGFIELREAGKKTDNETVKSYQDFIQHNPKSKFIGLAKTKLKEAQDKLSPAKPSGLYVGGQIGQVASVSGVNSSISLGGLVGYDINNTYSVELDYAALYRKTNADAIASSLSAGSTGTFSLSSISLVGQYAYHLSEHTKLLGGLGFHNSNYSLDSSSINLLSGHSSGLVFVLKAEYDVTKYFGLRAGIDTYIMQGAIKGPVTSVGAAALFKF